MSEKKDKILIITIIAFVVVVIYFLFKYTRKDKKSYVDNFFGDLAENYIEESVEGSYENYEDKDDDGDGGKIVKIEPYNGGLPSNPAKGGNCVTKDYLKIEIPNHGTTPITIDLNSQNADLDNLSIAQFSLDSNAGDGGLSSNSTLYISQGNGVGTVSAVDSLNGFTTNINIPSNTIDPFVGGSGFDANVFSVVVQTDGKILVGGNFTTYQGSTANRIIRLNADGTKDTTFDSGTGFNGRVSSMAVTNTGEIYVGGYFSTYKGGTANGIIKLNSDGSKDTSFTTIVGFNSDVYTLALQSDGKVVVGGGFTFYNGFANNYIIRINPSGLQDVSFNTGVGFDNIVYNVTIQTDGKVLAGGLFTTYKGTPNLGIARIDTNGSQDLSFNNLIGFNGPAATFAVQSDGKIIVGGIFTTYKLVSANGIIRLNSNGTKDATFDNSIGFDTFVFSLKLQSDGQILAGGSFTTYKGLANNKIIRLNTDGSADLSFDNTVGFDADVLCMDIQSGGNIVIGGNFDLYKATPSFKIVGLDSTGNIQSTIILTTSIYGVFNSVANAYYQTQGTNIVKIDANTNSPTFNTIIATFPVGATIGTSTNISVGQDGNLLIGNGNGTFGYMDSGTGNYLVSPISLGIAGDMISKAYLDDNGFLYFNFTTFTSIIQFDSNSSSITYLNYQLFSVGISDSVFTVFNDSLYYFSLGGGTLYRFNLTLLVTDSSLILPIGNTSGNISIYLQRFVISGSEIMIVDPISMSLITSIPLQSITISNTVVSQTGFLYALSSSGTGQTLILNLNSPTPFLLPSIEQGGFGVAGRSLFLTELETVIGIASGGNNNIIKVPNISNNVKAKFAFTNFNPIKVCGIKYSCNTVEQLANPLIFVLTDGVTGIKSDYRISLIDRVSTQQFNNIIFIDDINPPIILYSNQSIVHTVNAGEDVIIMLYEASGINRSENFKLSANNSDIGGDVLSLSSERPIPTAEYFESINEPSLEEIENDYDFDEVIIELGDGNFEIEE